VNRSIPWPPEAAARFREAFFRLGFVSQAQACRELCLNRSHFYLVYNGRRAPGVQLLLALAERGVCITWLLTGKRPTYRPNALLFQDQT
jgi:hypothetical protein